MYVISAGDTVSTATATPITVGRCTTGCIVPLCSSEEEINQVEGPQTSTDPFCYLLGPKSSLCLSFNRFWLELAYHLRFCMAKVCLAGDLLAEA